VSKLLVLLALLTAVACAKDDSETTVEVGARDYRFVPKTLDVKSGDVTFSVENTGKKTHEFEIFRGNSTDEDDLVDEIEDITPGLTKELNATLEAGTYTFICNVDDHLKRGMKGTLRVQ
jgi:plastocyanin